MILWACLRFSPGSSERAMAAEGGNAGKRSSRTRSRSPAPSSRSPVSSRAAPNGSSPRRVAAAPTNTQRPPYHSDGDSRPVLRGWFYEVVNRSMARPLLTAYLLALGGFCYTGALMPVGLLCRLLHAAVLAANSIFSDELHNCDKRLGGAARSKGPLGRSFFHPPLHRPTCLPGAALWTREDKPRCVDPALVARLAHAAS